MPDLGKKYTCYSCHTKFYDLGKPVPVCPKCGADQRDAEDAAPVSTHRGRSRVVEVPVEEFPEAEPEPAAAGPESDDEEIILPEPEQEAEQGAEQGAEADADDDDEEEEY